MMVPSLGMGDPDTLVKNLEETFSQVKKDNEEQEQQVVMEFLHLQCQPYLVTPAGSPSQSSNLPGWRS